MAITLALFYLTLSLDVIIQDKVSEPLDILHLMAAAGTCWNMIMALNKPWDILCDAMVNQYLASPHDAKQTRMRLHASYGQWKAAQLGCDPFCTAQEVAAIGHDWSIGLF